ncbi:MAG: InlB B-repeat-containing protein, partial [Paludibacteraceae bacterium]|nr:InlB B-repeat-containing protein [Paludibacteraceae bacterium]
MWGEESEWKCDATGAAQMPLNSSVSTIGNISLSTSFTDYATYYATKWLQFGQGSTDNHVDIATGTSGLNLTQLDLVVDWLGVYDGEGKGAWYEIQFCAESTFNESAIMPDPISLYKGDGTKELSAPAPFGAKSARIVRKGDPTYYYLLLYSVKVTAERGSTPLTPSYYHAVSPNLSSTQYECYGAYTQLFNKAVGDVVGNINDTQTWITGSCYYVQNDVYADKTGWQPSYANPSDGQGYVKLKKESDIVFCVTNCVEVSALAYGSSAYPTVITVYGSNGAQVGTPLVCAGAGALNNPSEWVYGTELDASRQYMVVVSAPNCASNVQDAALHQIRFKVSESSLAGLDHDEYTFVGGTGTASSNQIAMYNNMYFGRKGGNQQISDKGLQINSNNSFIAFKLNETSQVYFDVVATGAAATTGTWEVKSLTTAQLEGIKAQQETKGTATTYFSIDGEVLCSIGMSASGGAEVETNKTIILPAGCYWFGCTQADNNVHVKNVQVIEPLPTYTVTFNANGHGVAPTAITNVEGGATITEPAAPVALGWGFGGWYIEASCTNKWDFATSVVTSDTTLYAKWTEGLLPVQDVQDLEGVAVNNKVSMSWHIPGIVPLDGATTPIAWHKGGATYTYNEEDTTILFSGYGEWQEDQVGMAFPMKSDNITYIEYDYSAANLAAFANVWGGAVKDASTAYWEFKDPFDTDHTKGWHHAADTLNRIYWNGTYVDNPITDEIQQLAVYFNFGGAQGGNRQEVKFRNIRYHLADSADVAEIVIVRKANQAPTLEDYDKKWEGLGLTFDFVDDDIKTFGNTYYYTIYTISEKGVVSEGVSRSFYIDEAAAYSVTYDANGGVGDVPVEIERIKNEVFEIQAAPSLYKQGYRLAGWTYNGVDYVVGDVFTMPEENVVLTAKWEEYIVPQVQNLRITEDEPSIDSIPVAWEVYNMINYPSLEGALSVPYWDKLGDCSPKSYSVTGDTVNVMASMGTYGNSGIALNMEMKNVQTVTFEYKATYSPNQDVKVWGGVCDGTADAYGSAYWEYGDFHYCDGEWHTVTAHINREYYDGAEVTSPLNATQLVVFANSEATSYDNYPFWVRYVRYHCDGDSAEVANVVVVRKYGSKSENILDGEVVHTGLATHFADDLSDEVGGTYYYTVYALDENGVPSKGVTITYELKKKTEITLAYNAESG